MWTIAFWKATAERMLMGAAAAMLPTFLSEGGATNVLDVDWGTVLGIGAGAAVVMLLGGVAGNAKTGNGPSFTDAEQVVKPRRARVIDDEAAD